ncbi:unnamed protein product [Didymodactylos carnosus]|uniref:Aminoglycoside phosphotransferase domain-containing protein n=1 Tax=Didymodactylos carnosus TaxID=1234261 RepID=A0A814X4C7_9BILA|nr:unnamed protein product [Didymodactylos carnosus]CAF3978159.1 unnamed protein product [Didymodactylos carnosus]
MNTFVQAIILLFKNHTSLIPVDVTTPPKAALAAEFNSIYLVALPEIPDGFTTTEFVLRLSKPLHPRVKTQNEVGWLNFIATQKNSSKIRVPKLLFWSDSTEEIGFEYTVLEKLPGVTLCDIWETVDPQLLVSQVVDVILELRQLTSKLGDKKWFGGITGDGKNPGPFVEVTGYTSEHIRQFWPSSSYPSESYETLNLTTAFNSWKEYLSARLQRDIHVIEMHDSCTTLRGSFLTRLRENIIPRSNSSFDVEGVIAHRDLHFGNLLWSTETNSISGVLDWELAGIYPLSDWNPGNTLWTITTPTKSTSTTQERFFEMLDEELAKRDTGIIETTMEENSEEYHYQRIVSLTYWIVRRYVEGRGDEERVKGWMKEWQEHATELDGCDNVKTKQKEIS